MGSRKGSAFERNICKKLSLWWSNGNRDDIFWRTASSGARATQRAKKDKNTFGGYGDIAAIDPIGQPLLDKYVFSLKCGYSKDLDVLNILDSKSSKLLTFFKEINELAGKINREPVLIFKRNQKNICVMMKNKTIKSWCGSFICNSFSMESIKVNTKNVYDICNDEIVIISFDIIFHYL